MRVALFDLDGCLVRAPQVFHQTPHRIAEYAVRYLKFRPETARDRCVRLYQDYGTNLEGFLAKGYDVDIEHYHNFVHGGLPYHLLSPQPDTADMLCTTFGEHRRWIYSNADARHVDTVLARTRLAPYIDGIVCFETLMHVYDTAHIHGPTPCKPKDVSFALTMRHVGCEPRDVVLFDDMERNVAMAVRGGARGVLVRTPMDFFSA